MSKLDTARDLGYGEDVATMDLEHDALHGALCHFLAVPSYSLKDARGETMTDWQKALADLEEVAVLACQKLRQMHKVAARA